MSVRARLFALFGIIGLFALLHLASLLGLWRGQIAECRGRRQQWDALHGVIVKQYEAQKPSEVILRAFPQLRPFYESGTPEFEEARRFAEERRGRALGVLGPRPDC